MRNYLASRVLTDAVNLRSESGRSRSRIYWRYVPWKLGQELGNDVNDPFVLGWGFVITFEFNAFLFFIFWEITALLLSLGLLFGLCVAENGPAHGQPGVAVAVFMAPIMFVLALFGVVYSIARQKRYTN